MKRLIEILFGIFLFVFPFSLRFLVYEEAAYRFGHFSPWVSEFIYLPEILLVVTFGLWVIHKGFLRSLRSVEMTWGASSATLIILFILNAFLVTLWQGDWVLSLFFLWRVVEAGMLYLLVADKVLEPGKIVRILIAGASFQMILSLLQWKFNHSLGLSFLGEQTLGPDVLNVAKIDLANGLKQLRPYGTFLHPNILAGYLLVILFLALDYLKPLQKLPWLLLLGAGIYFTQSLAAFGVAVVGFCLWILFVFIRHATLRKGIVIIGFLVLALTHAWFFMNSDLVSFPQPAIQERLEQNVISRDMHKAHPLGVGVRDFTLTMENFSERKLKPWEFQPVHNTYFLVLNETGAQGLLILLGLIVCFLWLWRHGKALPLISLLLLAPFDHFLWDSFAGMMLIAISIGFFQLKNQEI